MWVCMQAHTLTNTRIHLPTNVKVFDFMNEWLISKFCHSMSYAIQCNPYLIILNSLCYALGAEHLPLNVSRRYPSLLLPIDVRDAPVCRAKGNTPKWWWESDASWFPVPSFFSAISLFFHFVTSDSYFLWSTSKETKGNNDLHCTCNTLSTMFSMTSALCFLSRECPCHGMFWCSLIQLA